MEKLIQHLGQDQGEYDIKAVTKSGEEAEKKDEEAGK
jgi:hypothetical protein